VLEGMAIAAFAVAAAELHLHPREHPGDQRNLRGRLSVPAPLRLVGQRLFDFRF